ncbi:hypothetical protein JHK85_031910 [Glycine max]|nr:hypothetical protein JHK85_031910 [Glycine max]
MALSGMRGLSVFVSDIRNCQNKEQVRLRVDKELGNIRKRFKTEKFTRRPMLYSFTKFSKMLCKLQAVTVTFWANFKYVDVILQLIDKAGEFISDDIWFCVVQFVTNNEDLQVSEYILGEFGHLLVRQPGCSPKVIFNIIHEKLPTVSYDSCIEVEIQQRAVEYCALSRKRLRILMSMLQSKVPLMELHLSANLALFVTDQCPVNGTPPVSQLSLVKMPIPTLTGTRNHTSAVTEIIDLHHPSRDVAVLDFSYKFDNNMINAKLCLPAVLNKFLQPIPVSAEEFFPHWKSLSGPPLKL